MAKQSLITLKKCISEELEVIRFPCIQISRAVTFVNTFKITTLWVTLILGLALNSITYCLNNIKMNNRPFFLRVNAWVNVWLSFLHFSFFKGFQRSILTNFQQTWKFYTKFIRIYTLTRLMIEVDRKLTMASLAAAIQSIRF